MAIGHISHVRRASKATPILLPTALAIALVGTAISTEPTYRGKTLSSWLKLYAGADAHSHAEKQAADAVRAIGTSAIPVLLSMLTSDDIDIQSSVPNAFEILGPAGAGAVPALAHLMAGTNEVIATLAGSSLGNIGAPALSSLLDGLTNAHYRVATQASLAIVNLGTNAAPAIPIFLRHLQSPNHFVRERAADALGNLHIQPDIVVPALANLLTDQSTAAVYLSLNSLARFEAQARQAAPAISSLLSDTDENIRIAATNALRQIAPDALPKLREQ